ncbi:hypothetical protein MAR_029508 [Mya arenaria]|uniref:Uncharacterized protein n=1 Tax=Mya arenaria TaxID=6604 RepID=A0ABY7DIR3_MYAAR|nr:hypothetical protein MAR_029508 [Mya arenaria]
MVESSSFLKRDGDVVDDDVIVVVDAMGKDHGRFDSDVAKHCLGLLHKAVPQRPLALLSVLLVHRHGDERVQPGAAFDVPPPDTVYLVPSHYAGTQRNAV